MLGLTFRRSPKVQLTGPTVHIRPPETKDRDQWLALRDASRSFLQPWEPTWAPDALTRPGYSRRLNRFQENWDNGDGYPFFIITNQDHRLAGGVTLSNIRRGVSQMASVGYWIGQPFARRGLMSEGLGLALEYAFTVLNLHRVEAACLPHNEASRGLLKKCGFQEEGLARQYLCINGRWQDHVTYGILRSDPRPLLPVDEL